MTAQATDVKAAEEFVQRLGRRRVESGAPVRNAFVSSLSGGPPPLATLLRGGGRGGQTRVKLYLSLLWVCAGKPYEASYPARAWAALLGLEDVEVKGVRRVQQASRDLADRGFITIQDRGGRPSVLRPLEESGSGETYEPPSETYNRLSQASAAHEVLQAHRYFRVPSALWRQGYLPQLTGPGLAMLLVLLCEQRGKDGPVWFSPGRAEERFGLAPSTRTTGLRELRNLGLVTTTKQIVSEDGTYISFQRRRNVHTLALPTTGAGSASFFRGANPFART